MTRNPRGFNGPYGSYGSNGPHVIDDFLEASECFLPEKRLLIAMIQRALMDCICPEKGKAHLQYDAAAWIFSSARTPFSLFWVCDILSSSPEHLHRRIQIAARTKEYKPNCVIIRVDTGGPGGPKGPKGRGGQDG
jgi:hypothetical protein